MILGITLLLKFNETISIVWYVLAVTTFFVRFLWIISTLFFFQWELSFGWYFHKIVITLLLSTYMHAIFIPYINISYKNKNSTNLFIKDLLGWGRFFLSKNKRLFTELLFLLKKCYHSIVVAFCFASCYYSVDFNF